MRRRSILSPLVLGAALVLAGCGGSDASSDGGDTAAQETEAAAAGSADTAAAEPSDTAAATTAAGEPAGTDAPTDTVPVDTAFTGEDSGEFCAMVQNFEDEDPTSGIFETDDPAAIEAGFARLDELSAQVTSAAPDEIRADFETVFGTFSLMRSAFEQAGWDAVKATEIIATDPELQVVFDGGDGEIEAAGARVDAYIAEACGIEPG